MSDTKNVPEESKQYWSNYLSGFDIKTGLPFDRKTQQRAVNIQLYRYHFDDPIRQAIKNYIDRYDASINILSGYVWSVLLHIYNNANDILFGACTWNNGINGNGDTLIHVLPLRVIIDPDMKNFDLLKSIKNNFTESGKHKYLSLEQIKVYSELASEESMFDSGIIIGEVCDALETGSDAASMLSRKEMTYQLAVNLSKSFDLCFFYNADAFERRTVERLAGHCVNIIMDSVSNPGKAIKEISFLPEEERKRLLNDFNDTFVQYPKDKLIHELFEQQVRKSPDNIALEFNGECLTYSELNEKSNRAARMLRKKGVGPDRVAAIMTERSIGMIIGVLAIVKAGGAYLPIDPEYPADRIKYMMEDSSACILVTQRHLLDRCDIGFHTAAIEDCETDEESSGDLGIAGDINRLLYIIYTSGSTGRPKGVMVEHRQMNNLIHWMQEEFCLLPDETSIHRTTLTFDPSTWEIFWPLFAGGKIKLLTREQSMDAGYLLSLVAGDEKIKMLFLPSSLVKAMSYILTESGAGKHIKLPLFHIGAEPIGMNTLKSIYSYLDGRIIDTYGPTECTVFNTYYYIERDDERDTVPIGKPIANNKIYILSDNLQLMPVNIPGEICIAGDNVSRGYVNNPEKTGEKFIQNPFGEGRLYRTGDIGRWLEDGNIEILGRTDHQVKIRGYRIELGEVEDSVLRYPKVKDCVVVVKERGIDRYLCAYVVANCTLSVNDLRSFLYNELPSYMVPAHYVKLDKMPLTPNGKIDRRALPEPEPLSGYESRYEAPCNSIEEIIYGIWHKILGIERIGVEDDFFELGGDSLLAVRVVVEMEKNSLPVGLHDIFRYKTIRELSCFVNSSLQKRTEEISYGGTVPDIEKIKPVHDDRGDCYDDIYLTVFKWLGREHLLMYSQSWYFEFRDYDVCGDNTLGSRIILNREKENELLKKYYGVSIDIHENKSCDEMMSIVKGQVCIGYPAGIGIDSYWCPSDPGYKKNHQEHYCLIIGIDSEKDGFVCMDPYYLNKRFHMDLEDFLNGVTSCITFGITGGECGDLDAEYIVKEALKRFEKSGTVHNLMTFGSSIGSSFSLAEEFGGYENFWDTTVFIKLNNISKDRERFSNVLKALSAGFNTDALEYFSKRLIRVKCKWDSLCGLFGKIFISRSEKWLCEIKDKIIQIAQEEEKIAHGLNKLLTEHDNKFFKPDSFKYGKDEHNSVIFLELSEYFNNKGLGASLSAEEKADLTGIGHYYILDGDLEDKVISKEGKKFFLSKAEGSLYDNISCRGQEINLAKDKYRCIMILGCAEWGNVSELMRVTYDDNSFEEICLEFTDWLNIPEFGETVMWIGKAAERKKEEAEFTNFAVRMFGSSYMLNAEKKAVKLKLPQANNLHIFAISVCK